MRIALIWILRATLALLIVFAGISAALRRREKKENSRFTLQNKGWLCGVPLCAGVILSIPAFVSEAAGTGILGLFALAALYYALYAANQRVRWDDDGFWYRTALRREIRFDYADVRSMRKTGTGSGIDFYVNANLLVRAGGRFFQLDSATGWAPFASAFAAWQTKNGQPTWQQTAKKEKWERYRRHGPFFRKLDRIPGGHVLFWIALTFGGGMTALGVAGLFFVSRPLEYLPTLFFLILGLNALGYPYAAAHIDDKPKLIRWYVQDEILPDPEKEAETENHVEKCSRKANAERM